MGVKLWRTHNAASASLSPRGTDTFLIWNYFSHHKSLRIYFFYSPVTSHIISHNQSHSQPLHKYTQITGVFPAQPMKQPFTNRCKYRSILSTANSTADWLWWLKIAQPIRTELLSGWI